MFLRILTGLIIGLAAGVAQAAPSNCTPVRQGKINVTVTRLRWVQTEGKYNLESKNVCTVQQPLDILPGIAAGCMYPVIADCDFEMDGEPRSIRISGLVYHNNDPQPGSKHFAVTYFVRNPSNNNSVSLARGNTDIYTTDPLLKSIGTRMNSGLNSPMPGVPVRDAVTISADFEDPNAK